MTSNNGVVSTVLSKRNYGIDALRIVSMYMVVIIHVLGQGCVFSALANQDTGYEVVCILIDSVREWLFKKLGIYKLAEKVDRLIQQ